MAVPKLFHHYTPKMYSDIPPELLRTGDVIKLTLDDFKLITKHNSMLGLFEQYANNPLYNRSLWALLNKPCDMIHTPEKNRFFKNNLFLSPLQGLKDTLRKSTLGELIHLEKMPHPENALKKSYKTFLKEKIKNEISGPNDLPATECGKKLQPIISPIIEQVTNILEEIKGEFEDPAKLLNVLIEYTKTQPAITESLQSFKNSKPWSTVIKNHTKKTKEVLAKNTKIILKSGSSKKLADLCLNQLDSQGIFYYEPSKILSDPDDDLSYIIQLANMTTLKINNDVQQTGTLVKLLKKNRVASLSENFSDRLLNIMGNFFFKNWNG